MRMMGKVWWVLGVRLLDFHYCPSSRQPAEIIVLFQENWKRDPAKHSKLSNVAMKFAPFRFDVFPFIGDPDSHQQPMVCCCQILSVTPKGWAEEQADSICEDAEDVQGGQSPNFGALVILQRSTSYYRISIHAYVYVCVYIYTYVICIYICTYIHTYVP